MSTVGHGGGLHAYRADFLRFPNQQFAVVCLCNTESDPKAPARQIARIYLSGKMKDDSASTSQYSNTRRTFIKLNAAEINEYAGDYFSEELQVSYRFVVEGGELKLFGRKSNDPVAYPLGRDWFFYRPGMLLEFGRDDQKRIKGFSLLMGGSDWDGPPLKGIEFTRVVH